MTIFKPTYCGLWLTDFDGTINPDGDDPVTLVDREALKRLKKLGWFRAVVTGRSLFGFAKAWDQGLEFDALIFSSGAGFCDWTNMGPGPLKSARTFKKDDAFSILKAAIALGYGFFAYHAPPDNHHCYFQRPASPPSGFDQRLAIYNIQSHQWSDDYFQAESPLPLSQVMIMVPAPAADQVEARINRLAPGLSVVRSTSPFGDGCLWLEIYPPGVNKGLAAAALAASLNLDPAHCVALGNDYNDQKMLDWAGRAFITADAPQELMGRYQVIPPAGCGGLAWALETVLNSGDLEAVPPSVQ